MCSDLRKVSHFRHREKSSFCFVCLFQFTGSDREFCTLSVKRLLSFLNLQIEIIYKILINMNIEFAHAPFYPRYVKLFGLGRQFMQTGMF